MLLIVLLFKKQPTLQVFMNWLWQGNTFPITQLDILGLSQCFLCMLVLPVKGDAFPQSCRAMEAALNLPPFFCRAVHRNVGDWEQVPFLSFLLKRKDFMFMPSLYSTESYVKGAENHQRLFPGRMH